MSQSYPVSIIQMNIIPEDVERNLATAVKLMEKAVVHGPKAILLPEMWSTDFISIHKKDLARSTEHVLGKLQAFSRHQHLYILGSLPELVEKKMYNTLYVISPQGTIAGKYRKNHLFKPTGEHITYSAGKDSLVLKTPLGVIGVAICFDVRYPKFINGLFDAGAEVLFISAQWPSERVEHWETLLKARAIENQIYVVAANRVGQHKKIEYPGHSMIIDPWGQVIARGNTKEEIITAVLDHKKIHEVRERIPMK